MYEAAAVCMWLGVTIVAVSPSYPPHHLDEQWYGVVLQRDDRLGCKQVATVSYVLRGW